MSDTVSDLLQRQIDSKRREIHTDGYPMSVGELVNLYRDHELDIHPEFQRFFRWSIKQKSRFIESLLLGIPIPSIFVFQRRDNVWDVIDGLQRLSTIFEFMGLLVDESDEKLPAGALVATEYLPALEGVRWEKSNSAQGLDANQQRLIKRAAIDIKIVRRESDEATKFDLFQRLNTGGSQLSDQEVRNCLLIMADASYYRWIVALRDKEDFQSTIAISDRGAAEQYDVELVLRFLMLKDLDDTALRAIGDLSDFLTDSSVAKARAAAHENSADAESFTATFSVINEAMADDAFRRFDPIKGRFLGGFSVSAFEAITTGVYAHLKDWSGLPAAERDERLVQRIQEMWKEPAFRDNSGSGIRASSRLQKTVPFARRYFAL